MPRFSSVSDFTSSPRARRRVLVVVFALLACLLAQGTLPAQFGRRPRRERAAAQRKAANRTYRSRNFIMHTDLSAKEAKAMLTRMETMLRLISAYWGRPNRKPIECYVVDDLGNWPQGSLAAKGRAKIAEGAGVTLTLVRSLRNGVPVSAKSVVYACDRRGTPQHEAVHAYCYQNFGRVGPVWYSEGMAEMGNYWRKNDYSVNLPEVVLRYLQESDPKPLLKIVDNTAAESGDSWQNYAWRWALCHLLAYNTNYKKRFRPLGLRILTGKRASFARTYGTTSREIAFEYRFFLEHLVNGLRADLITWNWNVGFRKPDEGRPLTAKIEAQRGWQPSRAIVEAGKTYQVTASGSWRIEKDGQLLTADSEVAPQQTEKQEDDAEDSPRKTASTSQKQEDAEPVEPPPEGAGTLVGIILDTSTMSLGEPFKLGTKGTFTAEMSGRLYYRCKDGWGLLADNDGEMEVVVGVAE